MAASRPLRRPLLAASLLVAAVSAQTSGSFSFLPSSASSTFPECGLSCTVLQTAQAVCVPPQAAVTNDQTYISCFCQSAYLRGLTSSGAVCSSCTNPADQQLLVNWYNGYCAGGYTSTLTATATTTSTTNTATNGATTTTAAASTSTASSSSKPSGSPSWFSTHWRWVVMLIVLAVAFTALGIFGTWYKKRHDARRPGLYHGDDRRNMTASGGYRGEGPAAAGFFSGSLRNLSKGNANSINNPSTTNSSNNNVAVSSKSVAAATTTTTRSKRQPSMSMIRSSIISNNDNNNNNYSNNNNHMWGPHQATAHTRDFDDITPVDGTAFRNSMAAAAAAAAIEKTGTMTTTTTAPNNASRTDISSIGTGGRSRSGSVAAGRAPTPRSNTNNGNSTNRLSKLSVHSSSTLQRQTSSNTLPRGPTPAPRSNELSPVSPIGDDE